MIQSKTIIKSIPYVLKTINIPGLGKKTQGKVRDIYVKNDKRILITTDRQSAFDVILGHIPYKGAVLNLLSKFWFDKTKKIVANHMVSVPDPNVMITKNCQGIPVEMVIRGYISGVTKTSIWGSYEKGERIIYGLKFPNGLRKNQKLPYPVITPTTHGQSAPVGSSRSPSGTIHTRLTERSHGASHDERLTREQIIERKIVPKKLYEQMEVATYAIFKLGSKLCEKKGLILVDTKYEFGLYKGKLTLIDEVHTPDSSRFWVKKTYQSRFEKGLEPENFDKEFLRLWYAERGYRGDGTPPKMAKELIVALAQRYISVYEKITGKKFPSFKYPIETRIINNLKKVNLII